MHTDDYFIVGLRFTYVDGQSDDLSGTNLTAPLTGSIKEIKFDLEEKEKFVGVAIETLEDFPVRISFIFMRTDWNRSEAFVRA